MLDLKPSHKPIKDYFTELEQFAKHGQTNEMTVRNAFQDLLQTLSKKLQWQFIEEYAIKRKGRRDASVDGALVDQFSLPRAFWEAKDTKDDLPTEVRKKFDDGYPQTNILFWQPGRAILYQDGLKILDADISTPAKLVEVLTAFLSYDLPYIKEWEHAVEEFKNTIPTLAASVLKLLEEQRQSNTSFQGAFQRFMELGRQSINPDLSVDAVEEMLIQHLLTRRIFTTIFNVHGFLQKNAVARELESVIAHLVQGYGSVELFLKPLDRFYKALEMAAEQTDDYAQKQTFLNTVYEKFFQGFAVKVADTHGIVYTPQPIVDFMVRSVEEALKADFNKSLASPGVHILDPFVGTGNFILRVMREIHEQNPSALRHKYLNELHCNEVMLLPYYIACLNIEHLYHELTGEYLPFPGICLVDTFELVEDKQLGMFTNENTERVQRQKDAPIFVIIGNPPYNAGQVNENDNNKNRKYPAIDKRVAETYAKDSKASNKNALSDPYVKAFRFASDKICSGGEGIVCFISNSGYLDGIAFDGMRRQLRKDFSRTTLIDLGGNVRKNPKLSGTTHNVFGIQVGVVIAVLEQIRNKQPSSVRYSRMDEFWTRKQKYHQLQNWSKASSINFSEVDDRGSNIWLTEGLADDWEMLIPLGSKEAKAGRAEAVFSTVSNGVKTNRDIWAYNFTKDALISHMRTHISEYNSWIGRLNAAGSVANLDAFIEVDDTKMSWSRDLKLDLKRGRMCRFDESCVRTSLYRPFTVEHLYFDRIMNEEVYVFPKIFPLPASENAVICVSGVGSSKPFQTLVSNTIPCLDMLEKTQCFPLHIYNEDGSNRRDNITDWGLQQFHQHYQAPSITKLDVFHYVYGILHDPAYREKYAANLRRELPRIPFAADFWKVAGVGKKLMDMHVHYEQQPEYPLTEVWSDGKPKDYKVVKMKRDKKDPTKLIYNESLTLFGIPANVDDYKLGNRSALDWIVDQYQVSVDKRSGIKNDPNRADDPTYIVRLIKKVVTVSVETVKLVTELKGS